VTELRDSTGNTSQNQYQYDIWGGLITSKETKSNPFLYSGEYWDSIARIQYLRARWYDPSVGRFIIEDTYEGEIKNPLSLNQYTYVENNPLVATDPSGHARFDRDFRSGASMNFRSLIGGNPAVNGSSGGGSSGRLPTTVIRGNTASVASLQQERLMLREMRVSQGAGNALVKDTGSIAKNTANLRTWAQEKGWVRQDTAGGVEQWGVKDANGKFSWRLKLKPETSTRPGLEAGSNQPRFDARLDAEGTPTSYINPFTGQIGGSSVGTHIPLGK